MIELKPKSRTAQGDTGQASQASSCCGRTRPARLTDNSTLDACCPSHRQDAPAWVTGTITTPAGPVRTVSTELSKSDRWEHFRCRTTAFRNTYIVDPGLYAVGNPDNTSDVLVSANYKYSFDMLRQNLKGLDAWLLVLDTKGINVWCAAGKGTFGTDELRKRISLTRLDAAVSHRRIVVPQLGAVGVSAHRVKQDTGFRVLYGPVYAKDIPAYLRAGCKATSEMRRLNFSLSDRLVLTPMEINPALKKYPIYALIVLVVFGLAPSGILFRDSFMQGFPFLLLGLITVLAGALFTPALLPLIPFRSFAVKGWLVGLLSVFLSTHLIAPLNQPNILLLLFTYLFFPAASSYIALQFTGSTTFTGMSGVKKELKTAIPAYVLIAAVSLMSLAAFKLRQWGVL